MRKHPIGTGPFKFVEYKPNEYIRLAKNSDYWKPGRPYLDAIEWTIIPNRSTQTLAFIAGKFDMTFPYEAPVQSMRDIEAQAPDAICELTPTIVATNRLPAKVSSRNMPQFRDPAVIMTEQMKQIYIDGVLDVLETANWYPKVARRDYMVGTNLSGSVVDDPDAYFYEHYACGSGRNYTNYCSPELEKMYEQQSLESDQQKRKKLVWEIDRRLQEDAARPMIYHYRLGTCRYKRVHGITVMLNSIF